MKQSYLNNISHIFFVGIGGSSLSGLAKIVHSQCIKVSGSDIDETPIIYELKKIGINIHNNHNEKNITDDIDMVVFSSAIKDNNPEIIKAKQLKIPILERSEFLGLISSHYKNVIAISGVHGKTTTTGMLANIFIEAGLKPTVHLGGICNENLSNVVIGEQDYFITEACEYKSNFLKLNPTVSVILNIELDHPDCYENEAKIFQAFEKFADKTSDKLFILESLKGFISHKNIETFDINSHSTFVAKNVRRDNLKHITYDCYKCGEFFATITLNSYLMHDVYNSLSAVSVSDYYGIDADIIVKALKSFMGIKRRMEYFGKINGSEIIHDYAHHPTAIKSVIKNCKQIFNKKIVCIFQPHTYSRTKKLMNEFLSSFDECDNLAILKTYPAREKLIIGATAKDLVSKLKYIGKPCKYLSNKKSVMDYIKKFANENNIILVLGAGDIDRAIHIDKQ